MDNKKGVPNIAINLIRKAALVLNFVAEQNTKKASELHLGEPNSDNDLRSRGLQRKATLLSQLSERLVDSLNRTELDLEHTDEELKVIKISRERQG